MASPSPLHRHQSSLEGVIDFSAELPLDTAQRDQARHRFYKIVKHFEARNDRKRSQYNRPLLVRLTYEYSRSQDNFLRAFFTSMALPMDDGEDFDLDDKDIEVDLHSALIGFVEYLFENFFLPLKACTRNTPQPSPAYHSAIQKIQGGSQEFVRTPDRVSALRGACLTRDHHRCVISRAFDQNVMVKRFENDGDDDARDDDGVLLKDDTRRFESLEVAHILPHSLTKANEDSSLDPLKQATLSILNMFDSSVVHLIEGLNIDRPYNAITLTHNLHDFFGNFRVFFKPVPDQEHTYQIDSFLPRYAFPHLNLPITRKLYLTNTRTIDPPSPRLLAIHSAIAHILHLSAAGEYIDKLFRDMEKGIQQDGSFELGRFVKLGLGGWLDGTVDACR